MVISTLDALNNDPWLLSLPSVARAQIIEATTVKKLSANHVLYRKGDEADYLNCVLSGRLRAEATTFLGNELVMTSLSPGQWFGVVAILDNKGRTHDVVANEESTLAFIPKSILVNLSKKDYAVHQAMVTMLCDHCRQAFELIDKFLLYNPEQRLAARLLKTVQSIAPLSEIKINQEELSKQVGISRQSINKILKKWESDEWIKLAYSSISIKNERRLTNLLQA